MAAESPIARKGLRQQNNSSIRQIVDRLNLREAFLVDGGTVDKLRAAGFRSQNALNIFLFAALPCRSCSWRSAASTSSSSAILPNRPSWSACWPSSASAIIGFYSPNIFISNQMGKRQKSIRRAWPDALDLMLICVESGVSIEAAIKRVSRGNDPQFP